MATLRIHVLDGYTANPGDLGWAPLEALGEVRVWPRTPPEQVVERGREADVLVVNKVVLGEAELARLPRLRLICVSATGTNNIDHAAARRRGIPVKNVVGYSTPSVAQHVFALLLELTNRVAEHNARVQEGAWSRSPDWSFTVGAIPELAGKRMGLVGLGAIGARVAAIARAFGMEVVACRKHPERGAPEGVRLGALAEVFRESDVVSLHVPLTDETRHLVHADRLRLMKPTAFLINTGRGPLIDEAALATALREGRLAGAGLDVLTEEPPRHGSPLIGLPNCIITPHMAWATREARRRLIEGVARNIAEWMEERH